MGFLGFLNSVKLKESNLGFLNSANENTSIFVNSKSKIKVRG